MATRQEVIEEMHGVDFTSKYKHGESGMYWGYCVEVPEARSQGETLEEFRENLLDAIAFMLEECSVEELRELREKLVSQQSELLTL